MSTATKTCRHLYEPSVDVDGYIWTVCQHCGHERHVEPKPDWYTFREQYERRHAAWEKHSDRA